MVYIMGKKYLDEIMIFANENPVCHLATVEGDQPRVRGMLLWYANETGFYFHTGTSKKIFKQIENNPKVELAFFKPNANHDEISALRVSGIVEILKDDVLKARLFNDRPWVKTLDNEDGTEVVIFKVSQGEAYLWGMANNLREDLIEKIII